MNYKEKKSKISVQCEICGVTKPSHNYMNVHMDKVHGVKMGNKKDRKIFKCDAEGCTFETFYPGAMYDHKKRHRIRLEERKTFSCEHCGVKTTKEGSLRRHILAVHKNVKEFKCKLCKTMYSTKPNAQEHIAIKHLGYKNGKEWRASRRDEEGMEVRKKAAQYVEFVPHVDKPTTHDWRENKGRKGKTKVM